MSATSALTVTIIFTDCSITQVFQTVFLTYVFVVLLNLSICVGGVLVDRFLISRFVM